MTTAQSHTPGLDRRQFHIRRCLGIGGFGEVYLAAMTSASGVRTEVAVKVLRDNLDPRSQSVQRLRDEAHLLAALNHPAIVRVNDLVLLDRRIALVTEYVAGADLESCIAANPPMPLRPQVEVVGRVAEALHAAWSARSADGEELRLVHRDIKPANIRISRHGDVKLLDFGIARTTVDGALREARTQSDVLIGSTLYMAPERFDRKGPVEPAGDVFSLGATLFEGMTGTHLFGSLSVKEQFVLAMVELRFDEFVAERMVSARSHPAAVVELLERMLRFSPGGRPTAEDVAHACEELVESLPAPTLRRWCRDWNWPAPVDIAGSLNGLTIAETTLAGQHTVEEAVVAAVHEQVQLPGGGGAPENLTTYVRGVRHGDSREKVQTTFAFSATPSVEPVAPRNLAPSPAPSPNASFAERRKGRSLALRAGGVMGVLLLALVVFLQWQGGRPNDAIIVASTPELTEPTPPPPTTPTPPVVIAPTSTEPPRATIAPAKPVAPKPAPTASSVPKPSPAPIALGAFAVDGPVPVDLRSGGRSFRSGSLAPGSYEIWADFGEGSILSGSAEITPGATVRILCSRIRRDCMAEVP